MVLRTVLAALLALCLAAGAAGWLMARASGHDLVQRLEAQQNDEVEVFARLLSSKIEQSQKVLSTVADLFPGVSAQAAERPEVARVKGRTVMTTVIANAVLHIYEGTDYRNNPANQKPVGTGPGVLSLGSGARPMTRPAFTLAQ